MNGWMDSESSRMYVVERRFGSFEAILRGVLEPYLTEEVKQALMALPRAFSIDTKLAFKDFFDRYGPFFIDQVYNGGTIKATVVLSNPSRGDSIALPAHRMPQGTRWWCWGHIPASAELPSVQRLGPVKNGVMRCRTGPDHYLHKFYCAWLRLWCGRGAPCGGGSERRPSRAQGRVQLEMCTPNRLWVTCPCCRVTGPRVDPSCWPAHTPCGTGRPPSARTLGGAGRHAGRWRRALSPVASHPRIMRAPALLARGQTAPP